MLKSSIRRFSQKGKHLQLINPYNEKVTEFFHESDDQKSVNGKIERLKNFQKAGTWSSAEREESFRKIVGRLAEKDVQTEGARLYAEDMGKPVRQGSGELAASAPRTRFFLEHWRERMAASESATSSATGVREELHWEALGTLAAVAPWNYFFFVATNVLAPALLTGSSVLLKPSEYALRSADFLLRLYRECGVPAGALDCAWGGADVGAHVTAHGGLDGVFFTGSVRTGEAVLRAAAARVPAPRCQLELGGKDGFYVAEDADVGKAAAALADGAMYNSGQSCCSVERVFVHRARYAEFTEAIAEAARALGPAGDPLDAATYFGPLARREQVAVVEAQVADARAKGARDLFAEAGPFAMPDRGFFVRPAVLIDCTQGMDAMREETFGPLVAVAPVDDDAAAVAAINDSKYGLTGGVFTHSEERARRFLPQLDVGSAMWNTCDRVSPGLPWSGRKESGLGATLGYIGIDAFLRPKAYHLNSKFFE